MMEQAASDRQLFLASPTNTAGPPLRMQEYAYSVPLSSSSRTVTDVYDTGCLTMAHRGMSLLGRAVAISLNYRNIIKIGTRRPSKNG